MKLELACADYTFPLLGHDDVLTLIGLLGIRAVDIGLFEQRSHLQPSNQFTDTHRSATSLKRLLDSHGLKAADVFLQVDNDGRSYAINHPHALRRTKAREWFQQTLEYTAICGAYHVTIGPGIYFEGKSRSESLARGRDELIWRIEQASRYQITVGIEPHIGSIASSPQSALCLIEAVPGLTLSLDYGHFIRAGVPDAEVEPLLAHASHFHVRGAREGSLQASFRDNTIDFRRIVTVMKDIGYRGYLSLEYVWTEWENCNRVDNLSETVLMRDYLQSLEL